MCRLDGLSRRPFPAISFSCLDATLMDFALLTLAMHMVWHLFMLYENMRTPLASGMRGKRKRSR